MLIFIDIETTGLEDEDKICSMGIIYEENNSIKSQHELFNDGKKIKAKASSINNITNEMLLNKPTFKTSILYKFLDKHNDKSTILVGHTIEDDIKKLVKVGFSFQGKILNTKRTSKHLIKECESYTLKFLRYELKLYKEEDEERKRLDLDENLCGSKALHDAIIVKLLYNYLLNIQSQDTMLSLSFKNVLLEKFEFGKYKGRYIQEVCENDKGYLEWLLSNMDLDDDLRYSISYYL
ncbi:MAG: DNA polymerase III subunit epsilon [Sulfurimonas sp.]|nr:MAG: DNA polymerase III subunit epsilon [Sulfurimonas sp.]